MIVEKVIFILLHLFVLSPFLSVQFNHYSYFQCQPSVSRQRQVSDLPARSPRDEQAGRDRGTPAQPVRRPGGEVDGKRNTGQTLEPSGKFVVSQRLIRRSSFEGTQPARGQPRSRFHDASDEAPLCDAGEPFRRPRPFQSALFLRSACRTRPSGDCLRETRARSDFLRWTR